MLLLGAEPALDADAAQVLPNCNVMGGDETGGVYSVVYCAQGKPVPGVCQEGQFTQNCNPAAAPCPLGMMGDNKYFGYCGNIVTAQNSDPQQPAGTNPATSSRGAYLDAQQAALNAQVADSNQQALAALNARANETGVGQASLFGAAKDVSETGANQAATVGALYCAQGANDQAGNRPDLASQNYGACKQYFDAAGSMRAGNAAYKEDSRTLAGDFAKDTLGEFEKNFGISGDDYLGRMLGSGGSRDELADMTKGKLQADAVAKAFDEATPQEGDKFVVDLGGKGAAKKLSSAMRAELKKALEKEKEPARRTASVASGPGKAEVPRIKGLEPLKDAFASVVKEKVTELTIFDVVRLKYRELAKRQDL